MLLRIGLLYLFIMVSPFTSFSQYMLLCKGLTSNGQPIKAANNFTFSSAEGYLYCIVFSPLLHFEQSNYLLKIEMMDDYDSTFHPHQTKILITDTTQNTAGTDILFAESGIYRLSLFNGNQTLTTSLVNINVNESAADYNNPNSALYFAGSKIVFCDSIDPQGNIVNKSNIFSFRETGGLIMALLDNKKKPFKSNSLMVKTYVYDSQDEDYSILAGESSYSIDPNAPSVKLTFRFRQRGEYRTDIFTADDVFITEGYVTLR